MSGGVRGSERSASDLTRNQKLVRRELRRASGPLSAYSILDRLKREGLTAAPQVYRALEKLMARGDAHRIESINAFVACTHSGHAAHESAGFVICSECGAVDEIDATDELGLLARRVQRQGFQTHSATIELSGVCAACRDE